MKYAEKSKEELVSALAERDERIAELSKMIELLSCAEVKTKADAGTQSMKAEDVYRTMIDNCREAIHVVQDEILKYANPTTFFRAGATLEKMNPIHFLSYIHPDDQDTVSKNYYRTLSGEFLSPYCFRLISEDESIAWKEVTAINIAWEGRPAVLVFTTDVTERIFAEEALRKSERQLADIVDFLPDATFAINREGILIAWNRAVEELSGIKAAEILGKGDYAYAVPFYNRKRPMLADLALRSDRMLENEYPSFKKSGDYLFAETRLRRGR